MSTRPAAMPLVTTLVVARRDNHVLLLLRRKPPNEGLWSPPGGKLEPGEDPLSGAVREFREETGLDPEQVSLAAVIWETDKLHSEAWLMFVYRARAQGEPCANHREGRASWIAIKDLPGMAKPPADVAMLDAALAPEGIAFIHVVMAGGAMVDVKVHPIPTSATELRGA